MYPLSCTNTHHDVTDLVNHGIVKNTETWISRERNITFLRNKKFFKLCLRWHILRSYRFAAEVTLKPCFQEFNLTCIVVLIANWFVTGNSHKI